MKSDRFDLSSLDLEALAIVFSATATFAVTDAAERRAVRFGLDLNPRDLQHAKRKLQAASFHELHTRTHEGKQL